MTQKEAEIIANRALLPGLEHAAVLVLHALNATRAVLAMPTLVLSGTTRQSDNAIHDDNGTDAMHGGLEGLLTKKRSMSRESRRKVGNSVKERWGVVREAGIDTKGKIPTNADLEKARKILEEKAKRANRTKTAGT